MVILNELANPALLQGVRGIIFDCDGVLIDSLRANAFYYNSYKAHFGLSPMSAEEENYVHTHQVWESLGHILPAKCYDEACQLRARYDYREVIPHIRMEDGLLEFLQFGRGEKMPMGIATSRTDTMDLVLSHLQLTNFFFPVITSFKVRHPKPNPESIHAVLDAWTLSLDEVVFIGDSKVDEDTAINAGVRFWAFKNLALQSAEIFIPDFWTLHNAMRKSREMGFL